MSDPWPDLHAPAWGATRRSLHLWMQVVGKVKLATAPFLNQWWEVAFAVTARGVTSGLIPLEGRSLEVLFDLRGHELQIDTSDGGTRRLALVGQSVADFHRSFHEALDGLDVHVDSSAGPSELADPVPFAQDTAPGSYDAAAVTAWWTAMLSVERVVQRFRTPFHGKSSPVNLFWGGFDLNHSRFNGRPHTVAVGAGPILRYGESEQNFSTGFWPGTGEDPAAVLYAYMTPAPEGVAGVRVEPAAAGWSEQMGEFLLPYDALRREAAPDEALLRFFSSAYERTADLAGWDRAALEGDLPDPVPGYRR